MKMSFKYLFSNTRKILLSLIVLSFVSLFVHGLVFSEEHSVPGCTDAGANNYDPSATEDDGSCTYTSILGCMDPAADNYDPSATEDDGSCTYPPVLGCTDAGANNYDPSATEDDGSCTYDGCTDPNAVNYNPAASVDNGSCAYTPGCTDPNALNYDELADFDNGSCDYVELGCTDSTAYNYSPTAEEDDGSCFYNPGCTNSSAVNYNPSADADDNSCYFTPGCMDPGGLNYNSGADFDDGSCEFIEIETPSEGETVNEWLPNVSFSSQASTCEYKYGNSEYAQISCSSGGSEIPAPEFNGQRTLTVRTDYLSSISTVNFEYTGGVDEPQQGGGNNQQNVSTPVLSSGSSISYVTAVSYISPFIYPVATSSTSSKDFNRNILPGISITYSAFYSVVENSQSNTVKFPPGVINTSTGQNTDNGFGGLTNDYEFSISNNVINQTETLNLQRFLNSQGFIVNTTAGGFGYPGNESNFFGNLTRAALMSFQRKVGIEPADGNFSPVTRSFINGFLRILAPAK